MSSNMNNDNNKACVNCGINISKRNVVFSVFELWPTSLQILKEWLCPYILSENDYICKFCDEHIKNTIRNLIKNGNITDENQPLPNSALSEIRNRTVCVSCSKSLLRNTYSKPVLVPDDAAENIKLTSKLICETMVTPHKKIDENSRVCKPCWFRKLRKVENPSKPQKNVKLQQNEQNQKNIKIIEEEFIELPNYKRSSDSSSNCVFKDCPNEDLCSISDDLRVTIIKKHHFLITENARVCQKHLEKGNWKKLFDADNSTSLFKPDHIELVLSFISTKSPDIDFSNILDLEDNVVEYFLGMSKESFKVILKTIPELQSVENGVIGFIGLLIKYWNGGSITKAAGLLKIRPESLELIMKDVIEILKNSPVTVNMGIDYLLKPERDPRLGSKPYAK